MKKICFLIGDLNNFGGTERVTSIIANNLVSKGYDVTIASISGGDKPFFPLNNTIACKSLCKSNKKISINTPSIIYNLRKLLKDELIDILIVADTIAVMFSAPALIGLEVKHIGWEHFNFKSNLGNKKRWFFRRFAAKTCDVIVTLTKRDQKFWLEGTKVNAEIVTIPNPCPFPIQSNKFISKGIDEGVVIAVGRLTRQKGFDMLLDAWSKVIINKPNWKLKIIGDGEELDNLKSYINQNGLDESVDMVGKVSNIELFYSEADIFCMSSRFEGFPMVLLETLSFGLPVVSFDCDTGPKEILEGTNSILVPKNNIDLLAKGLIDLIENIDKRQIIYLKSKEKVKEYCPSEIVQQWDKLLQSLY